MQFHLETIKYWFWNLWQLLPFKWMLGLIKGFCSNLAKKIYIDIYGFRGHHDVRTLASYLSCYYSEGEWDILPKDCVCVSLCRRYGQKSVKWSFLPMCKFLCRYIFSTISIESIVEFSVGWLWVASHVCEQRFLLKGRRKAMWV